jgi:hypothetical protein
MQPSSDRRVHPRRALEESVFGYLDGRRIDAKTANISAGGVFVASRQAFSVPKGVLLGLVFQDQSTVRHRVFLFGRVVRHEEFPVPGVGLAFERAVTASPRAELVAFLMNVLGISRAEAETNTTDDEGGNRRVFVFDTGPTLSNSDVRPGEPRPAAPLKRAAVLQEYGTTKAPDPARRPGPMTQQISVDGLRARTDLVGILDAGSRPFPVTVTNLGVKGATLDLETTLAGTLDDVALALDIPIRDASVPVRFRCRVEAIRARPDGALTIEVVFRSCDEGSTPGVLQAYVRWLFQRSMSSVDVHVPAPPRRSA